MPGAATGTGIAGDVYEEAGGCLLPCYLAVPDMALISDSYRMGVSRMPCPCRFRCSRRCLRVRLALYVKKEGGGARLYRWACSAAERELSLIAMIV